MKSRHTPIASNTIHVSKDIHVLVAYVHGHLREDRVDDYFRNLEGLKIIP